MLKDVIINIFGGAICENVNGTKHNKNCLLLYIKFPFLNNTVVDTHQNVRQVRVMAEVLNELEYNVDVCDYYSSKIKLTKTYDMIIDIHVKDNPIYSNNTSQNTIRIAYFTGSNPIFLNEAENNRIIDLYSRRGKMLKPRRQVVSFSKNVEEYEAVFFIGNRYNLLTYKGYNLPDTYLIPNTGYEFNHLSFDSEKDPKSFLYFGSAGSVHKGLDLLLEVFSQMSNNCELYVCGLYENEKDFCREYSKELYHSQNIHAMGNVNIWGEVFKELSEKCAYMILPSCSEGMAGSVVTCMSAGIIPICSKYCGYDEEDGVIILPNCSINEIYDTVEKVSQFDQKTIKEMSDKVLKISKEKYSLERFRYVMKDSLVRVITKNEKGCNKR